MSTPVLPPRAAPPPAARPPVPSAPRPARPLPWLTTLGTALAVLLAGTPVSAVVQGWSWLGYAAAAVAVVAVVGLLLHRVGTAAVAVGQCVAVLVLITVLFADDALLGFLPGPTAFGEFGTLIAGAGNQINSGIAPVGATPEILFLVTAAFGVLSIGVHLAAVGASAPAAAGVPLLAVFAVPAALADDLLPWWAMAGAALGFGVLLVVRDGTRRQLPGGGALIAVAVVIALGVGAVTGFVGTAGRFDNGIGGSGSGGSIGLSPFTALRGQLDQNDPVELFRVRGLPQATYLRALTLRDYIPDSGWQASRPEPGLALPGAIQAPPTSGVTDIDIQNVSFRDYWLPLYGTPVGVSGVTEGQWAYDQRAATAYTARPRQEDGWQEQAMLAVPTLQQLRDADGPGSPGPEYLNAANVDPRVADIARQVTQGAATPFDRAMALQDYFTGPNSQFSYSLQTAPGGGDDALVEFLTIGKVGYCEQYASAMAVMLRTVGVPARVAVGFTGGVEEGDYRSISTSDAHAWVEAWFPGVGWTTFDPTPLTDGRAIVPPYVLEARGGAGSGDGALPDDQFGQDQLPLPDPAGDAPAPELAGPDPLAPSTQDSGGVPVWPFIVVAVLVLGALTPAALRIRERRRRLAAVAQGGPDAAGAGWAELLAESADRGVQSPPSDTVRAAARRLVREHQLDPDAQQSLREVVGEVEASWYGSADTAAGTLDGPVRTVHAGIVAGSPLSLRQRLLPRSVMKRRSPTPTQTHDTAARS